MWLLEPGLRQAKALIGEVPSNSQGAIRTLLVTFFFAQGYKINIIFMFFDVLNSKINFKIFKIATFEKYQQLLMFLTEFLLI